MVLSVLRVYTIQPSVMRKRRFVKIQLLLLVIAVGLIVWRFNTIGEKGDGFLAFSDLSTRHLYEGHFEVGEATMVYVDARAAFETDHSTSGLVVFPWIVNRSTREVAWEMTEVGAQRNGVEATKKDSVLLPPGIYSAYYTTYGPSRKSSRSGSFLGLKPHWTNNPSFWMLSLKTNGEQSAVTVLKNVPERAKTDSGASLVWNYVPSYSSQEYSQIVRVKTPTQVEIQGTAALCNSGCDKLRIFAMPQEDLVWELKEEMASSAGGAVSNKKFDLKVDLDAGLYKFEYTVGRDQVSRSWQANPPLFPDDWGTFIYATDPSNVFPFDPWSDSDVLVSLLQAGNDEELSMTLELDKALTVIVYGMGEMRSEDSKYDYGWIEKEGRGARVWDMSYDASVPAGGDEMNRSVMGILTLEPGRYFLKYQSDGSHSYNSWNKSGPENPERWGIALFPLNPEEVDPASVRVIETPKAWTTNGTPTEATSISGTPIVVKNGLGDETTVDQLFVLEETSSLHIVALGEITGSSSFDFGWIERISDREKVWEMTYQNTIGAGGAARNRRFSGTITLEAGEYVAHFETDISHSYSNFDDEQPTNSQDWGLAIYKLGA